MHDGREYSKIDPDAVISLHQTPPEGYLFCPPECRASTDVNLFASMLKVENARRAALLIVVQAATQNLNSSPEG